MAARKTHSPAPNDVPTSVVLATVVFLLAVFVPLAVPTGDLPSTLPPLPSSSEGVEALHRPRSLAAVPPFLDESYRAVGAAMAQHDGRGLTAAQRDFAAMVLDATSAAADLRADVRETHLRHFLAALEGGEPDPLADIAWRHQLAGDRIAPGVDRATQIAWFDLRWEALAARETIRGESVSLEHLVGRLPAAERRQVVAWILGASCEAIVGSVRASGADEIERCADARRAFVDLALRIEPTYPADEALATIDAERGSALRRLADGERDAERAEMIRAAARVAFQEAHARFTAIAARNGDRRLARYVRGTLEASGQ